MLWFKYVVSNNMQKVIEHSAALHNMSETYPNLKKYVLRHSFLWLLVSNVVALLELAHLQVTSAQQTCQMARMESVHR